ncbi:MAG TPA: hypothetical protein PLL33_09780 [Paracoccus sp. (in: a-proteobacteria)]|nr:hypothetical protein [Paracoccus sp. (in: a-proteobacteria)]
MKQDLQSQFRESREWAEIPPFTLPRGEALRRLVSARPPGSLNAGYDLLRTRLLGMTTEHDWRRIGLIQPRQGPATAVAAMNLALSLARRPSLKILLADLDLAAPRVASGFGMKMAPDLAASLRARADLFGLLKRLGGNLAVLANARPDPMAGDTLQEPGTGRTIGALVATLQPDVALFILPPMLGGDAGLAGLALVEAAVMVLDGRRTTAADVRACERLDDWDTPMIGLFLAEAER